MTAVILIARFPSRSRDPELFQVPRFCQAEKILKYGHKEKGVQIGWVICHKNKSVSSFEFMEFIYINS